MRKFDERTTANMTVALEKVCHVAAIMKREVYREEAASSCEQR